MQLLLPHLSATDVNVAASADRQTALHVIADMGAPRTCRLPLERAAAGGLDLDLAATDAAGRTAHALALERGLADIAQMLASGGSREEEKEDDAPVPLG